MRAIKRIIWHCSATPEGRHVTVDEIRRWHKSRGWKDIGYHFVIYLDGLVMPGRPVEQAGAHVIGHNADSIGVCYVGGTRDGRSADTRTSDQKKALYSLTMNLLEQFPGATVHGHNEFSAKDCPCFDAAADWAAEVKRWAVAADGDFCPHCGRGGP